VAAFAQVMAHLGLLKAVQEQIHFARARFGTYDTLDFLVILIGYARSSEPTLKAFYERLVPFAETFMALFGRSRLPDRSTLSRFLADLVARTPFPSPGGMSDRLGNRWWIMDIDATRASLPPTCASAQGKSSCPSSSSQPASRLPATQDANGEKS
jgi:hypothetical protein